MGDFFLLKFAFAAVFLPALAVGFLVAALPGFFLGDFVAVALTGFLLAGFAFAAVFLPALAVGFLAVALPNHSFWILRTSFT